MCQWQLGDGAGVGKGRTVAGVIFENYLNGRKKAIWVSVSNDLKYDAERDLGDIGANMIEVYHMNKVIELSLKQKHSFLNSSSIQFCVYFSAFNVLVQIWKNQFGTKWSRE